MQVTEAVRCPLRDFVDAGPCSWRSLVAAGLPDVALERDDLPLDDRLVHVDKGAALLNVEIPRLLPVGVRYLDVVPASAIGVMAAAVGVVIHHLRDDSIGGSDEKRR